MTSLDQSEASVQVTWSRLDQSEAASSNFSPELWRERCRRDLALEPQWLVDTSAVYQTPLLKSFLYKNRVYLKSELSLAAFVRLFWFNIQTYLESRELWIFIFLKQIFKLSSALTLFSLCSLSVLYQKELIRSQKHCVLSLILCQNPFRYPQQISLDWSCHADYLPNNASSVTAPKLWVSPKGFQPPTWQPIRIQYLGHVTSIDQSEVSIHLPGSRCNVGECQWLHLRIQRIQSPDISHLC